VRSRRGVLLTGTGLDGFSAGTAKEKVDNRDRDIYTQRRI